MDWLCFSGARVRACVCTHLRSSAYWYDPAIPPGPTNSAESAVSAAGGGMGGVAGGGSGRDGGGGGCGGWKTVGVGWACPARRMAPIEGQRLGVCSRESGQRDDGAQSGLKFRRADSDQRARAGPGRTGSGRLALRAPPARDSGGGRTGRGVAAQVRPGQLFPQVEPPTASKFLISAPAREAVSAEAAARAAPRLKAAEPAGQ
jgi:hypothetical protein